MFGLRWIIATSMSWHTSPDCGVLKRARYGPYGWRAFVKPAEYGTGHFYRPCGHCVR